MEIPVQPVDIRIPLVEDLRVQPLAHLQDDLLVRFRLIEITDLHHGSGGSPPGAGRVALCAHGHRQQDISQSHRGGGDIGISVHDEGDPLHSLHGARHILRGARQRIGGLDPHHLDGIGEIRLNGLEQTVRGGMGNEIATLDAQREAVVQLLRPPLGRSQILTGSIARIAFEGVVHQDVATGHIHIAAECHEIAACQGERHGGELLIEG